MYNIFTLLFKKHSNKELENEIRELKKELLRVNKLLFKSNIAIKNNSINNNKNNE